MKIYNPELSNIQSRNIGENCTIHSHVWIGDRVKIGDNVRIQAFTFIPNGVRISDNVFIGPHVCFTNDKHPPADSDTLWEPIIVRNSAAIGANATILPGVTIGAGATIGAGSVVTKNVPAGETWAGNPAKKICKAT